VWKEKPSPGAAQVFRARFDRIFTLRTGFARSVAHAPAPAQGGTAEGSGAADIPLHTNASENDLRACVIKRKISGGTMSTKGRQARDVLLGLMKTCRKLGISFFTFLGDRLGLNTGNQTIPPLAELVVAQA
jgi:hypothetical protein